MFSEELFYYGRGVCHARIVQEEDFLLQGVTAQKTALNSLL
jgi:hypothetical protein